MGAARALSAIGAFALIVVLVIILTPSAQPAPRSAPVPPTAAEVAAAAAAAAARLGLGLGTGPGPGQGTGADAAADAGAGDAPVCEPLPELYGPLVLQLVGGGADAQFLAACDTLCTVGDRGSASQFAFTRTGAGYGLRTGAVYVARDGTLGSAASAASVLVRATGRTREYNELVLDSLVVPPAGAAPVTVTVSTPDRRPTFFVCNTLEDDTEGRGATAAGDLERSRRAGWA